jgi:MoxR-like ATPase
MSTASLVTASPEVEAAAGRFRGFFQELSRTFVEREDLLAQIALALLSREHVLMTGPPGTAKSGIAAAVLGRIVDERTGKPSVFARQFTESTVQTDLVGPIDFKTLMQTGRTEHFTDEGMLGAVHAFLDEVLDGRDMLLRTTLNVLQERELKQGTKTTTGQIECALMTTNRYLAEVLESARETLLAFVDRIAFVSFVPKGFTDSTSLGKVVRSQIGGLRRPLTSLLTIQDLDVLQAVADSVTVGDEICASLCTLLEHLDADLAAAAKHDPTFLPTRYLSTRTAVRLGRILRAICVYDAIMNGKARAAEAEHDDLRLLRLSVLLSGPNHDALGKLLERETDPRERRQLSILRTEREIFDRALSRVPKREKAKRETTKVGQLGAQMEKAIPAPSPAPLLETAVALAKVSDAGGVGASEAKDLLETTLGHLAERALRAGTTAGAGPAVAQQGPAALVGKANADVVTELSTLADGLEKASGTTRPVARWLRGRAIRMLLDSAALSSAHATDAEARLTSLERVFAQCATLRAAGADNSEEDLTDRSGKTAIERVEDELVEAWDGQFRQAVGNALSVVGGGDLGALLAALGPALFDIEARGARLGALGGKSDSLKSRVVAPRIEPLVRAAFGRVQTADRIELVAQVGSLVDHLQESNLRSVLPKEIVLRFAIEALVRSEYSRKTAAPPSAFDFEAYRNFRSSEQRVSLAYTTTELALRISPDKPTLVSTPAELVAAVTSVIAALPDALRAEVVTLDLARIDRAIGFVEAWWGQVEKRIAVRNADQALSEIASSKFFTVTRDEGALMRFALEARVVSDVFPEAVDRVAERRARIDALEASSSEVLNRLRRGRADAAWNELLGQHA